jgi:hypothetical protein
MNKCIFKDNDGYEWEILEVCNKEKYKIYTRIKIGEKYNIEKYAGDHSGMNEVFEQCKEEYEKNLILKKKYCYSFETDIDIVF